MSGGKEREPAGDVLFAESKSFSGEEDERIEDGAPSDLLAVEGVVEMARADGVLGKDQRARVRIPERESPVTNEHGEAIAAPVFISRRDDGDVRGGSGHNVAQMPDQIGAVVQAAVPGEDGAGCGDVRLRFAARFLRGMKGVVQDAYVAVRIGAGIIRAVGS